MDERENDGLTDRLRALRRDIDPPAHLRSALIPRRNVWRWAAIAAMCIASFAAGRYTTAAAPRPPAAAGDRYVLFLYGDAKTPNAVEAHKHWASGLAAHGQYISGVKLKQEGDDVSGYFVLRAQSAEEARSIAAECPHAKSGGRTALRVVEPI